MGLLNPWREARKLKADLVEMEGINRDYVRANRKLATENHSLGEALNLERSKNFLLNVDVERLNKLLDRAVFRDPKTGRLLKSGAH